MTTKFGKFTATLTAAVTLAVLPGCAQQAEPEVQAPAVAATEPAAADGPALWKVSDEDTTVYLFGTIHILPQETEWMTPMIANALSSSDVMVTEVLMAEMGDAAMQQKMMQVGMLPAGQTLRGLLTADQKALYEGALQKLGLPPAAFDQMKPWMAAMTLSILPLIQQGYDPESGVEKMLEAQAGDIDRAALETVDYQISVFDGMPQDAQIEYLVETAEQADDIKAVIDSMIAEWVVGDADGLAEIMNEGLDGDSVLAERLLYTRNGNWAEWIDERLDQPGTVFVAVGAGHLAGSNSVQDKLAERDLQAVRVQ